MKRTLLCVVCICVTLIAQVDVAEDQASVCRRGSQSQNCESFQQCCGRHCQGAHDASCTEDNGRILAAHCYCEVNSVDGESNIGLASSSGGGSGGGTSGNAGKRGPRPQGGSAAGSGRPHISAGTVGDSASVCRARSSTCNEFVNCCNGRCQNPLSVSCKPGELYDAICKCPGDLTITSDAGPRPSGGSSAGGKPSTGADHTATCKITAKNDCIQFKRCCVTKCETKYSSRCSADGSGRLISAYCRCTTNVTTTIVGGRRPAHDQSSSGGSIQGRPGSQDYTQTCRDQASSGSCDSFRNCCKTRCSNSSNRNESCNSKNGKITTAACSCRS